MEHMLTLLEDAAAHGAKLVIFPELAFTTFFPRWLLAGAELDAYYERAMPNPAAREALLRIRRHRLPRFPRRT